ncbi:MAG: hypothetical protein RKK15_09860 [Defluviicoccus sp.]|nr:hypothetical protein [Defluviicoccus sp.]
MPTCPLPAHPPSSGIVPRSKSAVLVPWLRAQSINVARHAAALRPFRRDEFGTDPAAPSEGHIRAVNVLMTSLRRHLLGMTDKVRSAAAAAIDEPSTGYLQRLVSHKERAHDSVRSIERIWDFYFELFGQRESRFGRWLAGCDRIALDCYQHSYLGIGVARSVPAPPPFCYMRTGFSPATFRRRIPLRALGQQLNPFPLIQLPYHRLVNPWTLGAILHELGHNLHNDLGLAQAVPDAIVERLLKAGFGRRVAAVWRRWNREVFADLIALRLGGPFVVGSLLDVIGRSAATVVTYSPTGPHPTPYLRALISFELLHRMGFQAEAERYRKLWSRMYPIASAGNIPRFLLETFPEANQLVVDTVCYKPYPSLGNKSLSAVLPFEQKEQRMIEEAGRRLAAGTDPGVVPERFLIGAARYALDNRLARPGVIAEHFFKELARN